MQEKGKSNEEIKKELEDINAVLDGIAEPVVVIDMRKQVRLMNSAAREFFGLQEEPASLTCFRCLHRRETSCEEGENVQKCPLQEVQRTGRPVTVVHEHHLPNGDFRVHELVAAPLRDTDGTLLGIIETIHDITERRILEDERDMLLSDVHDAFAMIKTLKGHVPICAWCKKVREPDGGWCKVEHYVQELTEATFTHGICPLCMEKIMGEDEEAS
jgi:PAS domain S-box-containing protein